MKKIVILCIVPFVFVLVACEDSSSPDSLVKKRIFQHVDNDRMGTLKDLEIVSVKKINDTTYEAVHTFTNPIVEIEMQVKRNYFFTTDIDSIKNKKDLKIEMKLKDEWVKAGPYFR
jgi:hypothetical protein